MDKTFDHQKHESNIYKLWESSGAFTPKINKRKKPYTIIMPPPNANDPLHIGHARGIAIEDILVRFNRMKGNPTLWLPGADHAGIETQFVFEKRLKEKGKSRFDYDNDTLYKMIWNYVHKNINVMQDQLRILGASCDWTRYKFTLDKDIQKVVLKTFKKLFDDGLVYRGERIVNYCPRCGTNFSELEINHEQKATTNYFINYGPLVISTVRPETIFADVAVAVNPKDKRYVNLIGKTALVPIINREIPIIADSAVDPKEGTGALKVTPGHSAVDFEIGQRHKLQTITVIDKEGKLINTPKKYIGLTSSEAKKVVGRDLELAKKLDKHTKTKHITSICYRDKSQIEPLISKQWFIKVKPLTKLALAAIKNGDVKFTAKKFEKISRHWLKNLKDWNISRQIAWGIQIPAFRCNKCLGWTITDGSKPKSCSSCSHQKLTQDTDTFDTWFSSAQWPFATLMTTKNNDFEYFYPTSVMNTSYDILPFWVIRMIMLGLYQTKKIPFKRVFFHGLIRDKHGQKISKSKGNVIDPIQMTKSYGADALRMGIIWGTLISNDTSLSEENIRAQRNFANKLWNISRFITLDNPTIYQKSRAPKTTHKNDKNILIKLKKTTKSISTKLDKHQLSLAAHDLYQFIWNDFASNYLESTKNRKRDAQPTLEFVLQQSLKLAHPFMPFVTEQIYQTIFAKNKNGLLITSTWPK